MANSSARNRQVAVGIITKYINVDDFNLGVFSNIVYPTEISMASFSKSDGSDPINISYIGDISGASGSPIPIPYEIFNQTTSYSMVSISGSLFPIT